MFVVSDRNFKALRKNLISAALFGLLRGKYQRGDRLGSLQAVIQRSFYLAS